VVVVCASLGLDHSGYTMASPVQSQTMPAASELHLAGQEGASTRTGVHAARGRRQ
jgi:hypothetical protein